MNIEREVSLKKAVIVVVIVLILLIAGGLAVGYKYFWEQYDKRSQAERDVEKFTQQLRQDEKNIQARINLAWAYIETSKYQQSLDQLDQIIAAESKNTQAYFLKGIALQKLNNNDAAIEAFKRAREIDWKYVDPAFNLAELYILKGDADNALSNLKLYLGINPSSSNAHVLMGKVYEMKGKQVEAKAEYEKALQYDPGYQDAADALAKLGVKN